MNIFKTLTLAISLVAAINGGAQVSYDSASAKAQRFFDHHEWANASAMYTMILHEHPDTHDLYGKAIVVTSILNDTIRSQDLLRQAMKYNMPLESVLSDVQKNAFIAGRPELYEKFLQRSARDNEWMKRAINAQLLKYYTFRSDGPQMERYASLMLKGSPDNAHFLLTLARAYMLQGNSTEAAATWHKIISTNPDNYDAIINLANYYSLAGQFDDALPLYVRAYDLRPTPYVQQAIERLSTENHI